MVHTPLGLLTLTAAITPDGRNTRHIDRRRELLEAAVDYLLSQGLSNLSIRPMAEALGISHRTLLHHFGNKEHMIATVMEALRQRELNKLRRLTLDITSDPADILRIAWSQVTRPDAQNYWRAFFEIYGIALNHPQDHKNFLHGIVDLWLPQFATALRNWGLCDEDAQDYATLMLATLRGLVLDLLTSGDETRVQSAFELQLQLYEENLVAAKSYGAKA